MNHFKNILKAHLDGRASTDALFAKAYSKENKNIDECCNYIISEVRKTKREGFEDTEIYNMAVHYYDENEITNVEEAPECRVVVNRAIQAKDIVKPKRTKPTKQELVENFEKRQLSLF